jgi:Carboxypeptidase regulatory-like domain
MLQRSAYLIVILAFVLNLQSISAIPTSTNATEPGSGEIKGRLVDIQGKGISGVTLELRMDTKPIPLRESMEFSTADFLPAAVTHSDADGHFVYKQLPGLYYLLLIVSDDYVRTSGKWGHLGNGQAYDLGEIRLLNDASLGGRLVTQVTKKPIAGALLSLRLRSPRMVIPSYDVTAAQSQTTMTDENGSFLFDGLYPSERYELEASPPNHKPVKMNVDAGKLDYLIRFKPGAEIKGKVLNDSTGEPLGGIKVILLPYMQSGKKFNMHYQAAEGYELHDYSDKDGNFKFSGLQEGIWTLTSYSERLGLVLRGESIIIDLKEFDHNQKFELRLGPGSVITGIVTDEKTKKPLANAEVHYHGPMYQHSGLYSRSIKCHKALTDQEGRYRVANLGEGRYKYFVKTPGYMKEEKKLGFAINYESGKQYTHDIKLMFLLGVSGIVRNKETGFPVPDVKLTLSGTLRENGGEGSIGNGPSVKTDRDGKFAFENFGSLQKRCYVAYYLKVDAPGYASLISTPIAAGSDEVEIMLVSGGVISNHVVDAKKESKRLTFSERARIKERRFNKRLGRTGNSPANNLGKPSVDTAYKGPKYTIKGKVCDKNNKARSDVFILLEKVRQSGPIASGGPDPDGRFAFGGLIPGYYLIMVQERPQGDGQFSLSPNNCFKKPVHIQDADVTDIVIKLESEKKCTIIGKVINSKGEPWKGGVRVYTHDKGRSGSQHPANGQPVDPFGRFKIDNIPPGSRKTVLAQTFDWSSSQRSAVFAIEPGEVKKDFVITLDWEAVIEGHNKRKDGKPLEGLMTIFAMRQTEKGLEEIRRSNSRGSSIGHYILNGLPPGPLKIYDHAGNFLKDVDLKPGQRIKDLDFEFESFPKRIMIHRWEVMKKK